MVPIMSLVNPLVLSTVIVFVRKGVAVSILTTLPPHEAVRFARTLAP